MHCQFICTQCGRRYSFDEPKLRCDGCGEPLEAIYKSLKPEVEGQGSLLRKFRGFYPFGDVSEAMSLGEGRTPLIQSSVAGGQLGIDALYFKDETQNPTWSFKDRGTLCGVQYAISLGYKRIGTVSTGNMAASVAAYGARAGLSTFILVSAGIPAEKVKPIAVYGPHLIRVKGHYHELYDESLRVGEGYGIYFINSDAPFRVEGSKTIAFEICEQMHFHVPDYVVIPVSSGGNFRGILKGFEEFKSVGLIDDIPKLVAVQAEGCPPIAEAFEERREKVRRVRNPKTIARAIENPYPPSGNQVLRKLGENGGLALTVSDGEILDAQRLMAREGVFGQPAACAPLAATKRLISKGYLKPEDRIVLIITGAGLKIPSALDHLDVPIISTAVDGLMDAIGKVVEGSS
ncbi:MAG: threonine synthase [Syntrophobacterales bacterium]|nr:MAG: threonine synthase [Syntrophobacterales bacterium]